MSIIALVTGMATFTVLYSDHGSRKEVDYGSNQRKHDNSYGKNDDSHGNYGKSPRNHDNSLESYDVNHGHPGNNLGNRDVN